MEEIKENEATIENNAGDIEDTSAILGRGATVVMQEYQESGEGVNVLVSGVGDSSLLIPPTISEAAVEVFGEDDGVEVADNLDSSVSKVIDFSDVFKRSEEDIEKEKQDVVSIDNMITNLTGEVNKLIDGTIKTNYFEVVKTQKELESILPSVHNCIGIINTKKELDVIAKELSSNGDTSLADKIAEANTADVIGEISYDELITKCNELLVIIDKYMADAKVFMEENKESFKMTSNATAGIIEMLEHTLEVSPNLDDEKRAGINSFIGVYKARGEIGTFEEFFNISEEDLARTIHKFRKTYLKKKKNILRYNKLVLSDILGKNNVGLFYLTILPFVKDGVGAPINDAADSLITNESMMDMFVYTICRNIYLKDSVIDKLKAKLVILSIFDIYHEVYDYGNEAEVAAVMAGLYERMGEALNKIIMTRIKDNITQIASKKAYDFN